MTCEESEHVTVDDEREGNVVCIKCGLVMGPIYLNLTVNKNNVHHQNIKKAHYFNIIRRTKIEQ